MGGSEHPGILYFYSESIGFGVNGVCAFIAALTNLGVGERDVSTAVLFIIIGGVMQLLCSLRAFRAYDHFGSTVLGFYSAFWTVLGLEILLDSDINLLHIALLVVGVLLMIVAPLINGFYTVLVASITLASALELVLRIVSDTEAVDVVQIIAAVSELLVVLATSYGVVAAVLHGIHERQVLPGFDDALIETVLWKRPALKSKYSDGTWANPLPLGNICSSMGFVGMATLSQDLWNGSGNNNWALTLWLSTWAVLLGLVSLFHSLRHEQLWSVSSICDACLFAVSAISINAQDGNVNGGIYITFAVVRLFLMAFGIAEKLAFMHNITFMLQIVSLLAISIESFSSDETSPQSAMASIILFSLTSVSAVYNGIANLANSIAQKLLFPTGQDLSFMTMKTRLSDKLPDISFHIIRALSRDSDTGSDTAESLRRRSSGFSTRTTTNDDERRGSSRFSRRKSSGSDNIGTSRRSSLARRLSSIVLEYANTEDDVSNEEDDAYEHKFPGDHKVLGTSDFQTPLFIMTTGIVLYSAAMSIGLFTNSSQAILMSALLILITQTLSLLMATFRGQTCFGFLSFSYVLEGIILLVGYYSGETTYQTLIVIAILQFAWLVVSFNVFRFLSVITVFHLVGLCFYIIWEGVGVAALMDVSGVFYILTSCASLLTLGLLFGSTKSNLCRWLLQHTAADTEELCEVGFASDREKFDECIQILRDGGVCCIPTDTVYCLACKADSPDAIQRIYDIKSRPSEKPLSLWLGSIDDIKNVAPEGKGWSPKLFAFMERMWPGSVSLVVSRGEWLQRMGVGHAADLIGTKDSIALRVPNSTLTVALLKETGKSAYDQLYFNLLGPLAITSANPSGACDCTHHNKVDDIIAGKIDYILADGASPMTIASSVVDVRNVDANELFFYRVGCVPEAYIWSKLNGTTEEEPLVLADIDSIKASPIQAFLSQLTSLVKCDSYKVFVLVSADVKDLRISMAINDRLNVKKNSWESLAGEHPRIRSAFLSGISYYDGGRSSLDDEEGKHQSQMIVPIRNRHGKVIAILQLLNKISNGRTIPFEKEDVPFANMASTVLRENIDSEDVYMSSADVHWTRSTNVVVLSETTRLGGKVEDTNEVKEALLRRRRPPKRGSSFPEKLSRSFTKSFGSLGSSFNKGSFNNKASFNNGSFNNKKGSFKNDRRRTSDPGMPPEDLESLRNITTTADESRQVSDPCIGGRGDLDLELDYYTSPFRPRRATETKENWKDEVAELLQNENDDRV